MLASEHHRDESQGGEEESPPPDPEAGRRVSALGDAIRAEANAWARRQNLLSLADRADALEGQADGAGALRAALDAALAERNDYRDNPRDEYHTMDELYEYRMVYNAWAAMYFADQGLAIKSWNHHDGELCFGGGWFIVCLYTLDGWVTNHYEAKHWDLFNVPIEETAPEWDGHTPAEGLARLRNAL
jgi:hypothetical protein